MGLMLLVPTPVAIDMRLQEIPVVPSARRTKGGVRLVASNEIEPLADRS
jgi:hypothetical protein